MMAKEFLYFLFKTLYHFKSNIKFSELNSIWHGSSSTIARQPFQTSNRIIFLYRAKFPTLCQITRSLVSNMADINQQKKLALLKTILDSRRRRRLLQQNILAYSVQRRQLILKVSAIVILLLCINQGRAITLRSCRRLRRHEGWWNNVWTTYGEKRFKKTFRVSRETFQYILSRVRHDLERHDLELLLSFQFLLKRG